MVCINSDTLKKLLQTRLIEDIQDSYEKLEWRYTILVI